MSLSLIPSSRTMPLSRLLSRLRERLAAARRARMVRVVRHRHAELSELTGVQGLTEAEAAELRATCHVLEHEDDAFYRPLLDGMEHVDHAA